MIEESYVSFETARMLKEAGFEADCGFIMDDDGKRLYRPTQSLAARWLREVHNIDVVIIPQEDGGYYYDILVRKRHIASSIPLKESYEKVLEYGLFIAVKLIKK